MVRFTIKINFQSDLLPNTNVQLQKMLKHRKKEMEKEVTEIPTLKIHEYVPTLGDILEVFQKENESNNRGHKIWRNKL